MNELTVGGYTFVKDGSITSVGCGRSFGTDVYWSANQQRWVFVCWDSMEPLGETRFAERIAAVRCNGDPDDGLNQLTLACDLEGKGVWIVDARSLDSFVDGYVDVLGVI